MNNKSINVIIILLLSGLLIVSSGAIGHLNNKVKTSESKIEVLKKSQEEYDSGKIDSEEDIQKLIDDLPGDDVTSKQKSLNYEQIELNNKQNILNKKQSQLNRIQEELNKLNSK